MYFYTIPLPSFFLLPLTIHTTVLEFAFGNVEKQSSFISLEFKKCLSHFKFCFFLSFYTVFCTTLRLFPLSVDTYRIPDIGQFLQWAVRSEGDSCSTGERMLALG